MTGKSPIRYILIITFLLSILMTNAGISAEIGDLTENQTIADFRTVNLYEGNNGQAVGARFVSVNNGFVVDLLRIQSVPQGFFWIKTPPKWDKGEPHTCEHLLLGKGSVGKNVAALEEMALGNSSAYTAQLYTAYHFNTIAGEDTFYDIFHAKLNALLNPDFTDEEIRREVCHVGVVVDPKDGRLSLDEKGTVYTEMVTAFEKNWYHLSMAMDEMIYGEEHPVANVSGGDPAAIRTMTPQDLWEFHSEFYVPSNMGVILSIPDNIESEPFMERISAILQECVGNGQMRKNDEISDYGITETNLPDPQPQAEPGTIVITGYPNHSDNAPGQIQYAWQSNLELDNRERMLLNLFLNAFADGTTSLLYNLFVNSQTSAVDFDINWVSGSVSDYLGHPVTIDIGVDDPSNVNESIIDTLRSMIVDQFAAIRQFEDGSAELLSFNADVRSRLESTRKYYNSILDSPPMFGFRRGRAGAWSRGLEALEKDDGFRKSLTREKQISEIEQLLDSDKNIWRDLIDDWKLLETKPYVVGIKPDPKMLTKIIEDKSTRIDGYIEEFKQTYGTDDDQAAIRAYQAEFDAKTAELEQRYRHQEMPKFIDTPPMTLDDLLKYETISVGKGIPLVASTFDNMTSATFGVAFRLDVIPEEDLMYVPLLPSILTRIGVIKDGQIVDNNEMDTRLRKELLSYDSYFDFGMSTDRVELLLRASASNRGELTNIFGWMNASLFSPNVTEGCIPRLLDIIDQRLVSLRNTMKRGEEAWVDYPANAYRFQHNPLFMSANCFLTQTHHLQRLRWQLTALGNKQDQKAIEVHLKSLAFEGSKLSREDLIKRLESYEGQAESDPVQHVINRINAELKVTLNDIPDETLSEDVKYLCGEIQADLRLDPTYALEKLRTILTTIQHADNARMFTVSSGENLKAVIAEIESLAQKLNSSEKSVTVSYNNSAHILSRAADRINGDTVPTYVGLVNNNTQNGLIHFSVKHAAPYDSSENAVLDALASQLFSGYGAHGLFMKTWSAGLAYSNGIRYRDYSGRIRYYAERCPDIAETMRFVVNDVKQDISHLDLNDYIVALCFGNSRAPDRYETRGEAMASDLADGFTPEVVSAYRSKVLALRSQPNLAQTVRDRLESVYGKVFVGYGADLSTVPNGNFFIIGPEEQFLSMENYIESCEQPQKIVRLYPRDFWIIRSE